MRSRGSPSKGRTKSWMRACWCNWRSTCPSGLPLEQFERGDVKVNAVRQMLDRMNQEIEHLRNILGQHEDKMAEAGILAESQPGDAGPRLLGFGAGERETGSAAVGGSVVHSAEKRSVLRGGIAEAGRKCGTRSAFLQNYASCADNEEPDARKRAATGLSEMAGFVCTGGSAAAAGCAAHIGLRLSVEQDQDLQSLVSAAFVRLSQEAATHRHYAAMSQALNLLDGVESPTPGNCEDAADEDGDEERVPEFVEEALRARGLAAGLTGVLKHLPQTAMEQLSTRFNRCQFRSDLENVATLAQELAKRPCSICGIQCAAGRWRKRRTWLGC